MNAMAKKMRAVLLERRGADPLGAIAGLSSLRREIQAARLHTGKVLICRRPKTARA